MSEKSDLCQALDNAEEETLFLLRQKIPNETKTFWMMRRDTWDRVRNHTNCQRDEKLEREWRNMTR